MYTASALPIVDHRNAMKPGRRGLCLETATFRASRSAIPVPTVDDDDAMTLVKYGPPMDCHAFELQRHQILPLSRSAIALAMFSTHDAITLALVGPFLQLLPSAPPH